jgi:hypothetical protein
MLVGAATLVCGTHLFLLATSDWDSATLAIEPSPPTTATISIELSGLSKPTRPVAELKVAAAPVAEQPSLPSPGSDMACARAVIVDAKRNSRGCHRKCWR